MVGSVVWLHILLGPYWCVCVCGALLEMREKIHINNTVYILITVTIFDTSAPSYPSTFIKLQKSLRLLIPRLIILRLGVLRYIKYC